jgi:hypothetical protein
MRCRSAELVDLPGGELAGVALGVQSTQGVEPLVAIDAQPFAQLAQADAQQVSDVFTALALGNGQDSGEALVDTPVKGFLAALLDAPSLLGTQDNRLHGRRCGLWDGSLRLPSFAPSIVGGTRRALVKAAEGVQSVVAKDTKPMAQLGEINP